MKKSFSILSANLLFLVTLLLVVSAGSIIQALNLSLGLIATEFLLILLPVVVLLRTQRIPWREGLHLNPISLKTALICLLLGLALFPFSLVIEVFMLQLTGMPSVPGAGVSLPKGLGESLLYFAALALSAPLCEEILFRGAIQGAYERQRPAVFSITITALMFAIYHLRVSGLLGLLPISFALGYAAWRTRSIYASMLAHFGMNAASAAHTLVALNVNGAGLPVVTPLFALGGLLLAGLLILALNRIHSAPLLVPAPDEPPAPRRAWLANYWPLIGGGLIYLGVAGLTLAAYSPALNPTTELAFYLPRIDAPIASRYQITNRAGQLVGELNCTIAPHVTNYSLDCTRSVQAYQVQVGSSFFADGDNTATWHVVWDAKTLSVLEYTFEKRTPQGNGYASVLNDGWLTTTSPEGSDEAPFSQPALIEYEWPWHINTLKDDPGSLLKIPLGYLARWDAAQKKAVPVFRDELMRINPSAPFTLPAGQFDAWKVTYGQQAAWYARSDPKYPRPIQFDDGQLLYSLMP